MALKLVSIDIHPRGRALINPAAVSRIVDSPGGPGSRIFMIDSAFFDTPMSFGELEEALTGEPMPI
jgi:hypothetical protein